MKMFTAHNITAKTVKTATAVKFLFNLSEMLSTVLSLLVLISFIRLTKAKNRVIPTITESADIKIEIISMITILKSANIKNARHCVITHCVILITVDSTDNTFHGCIADVVAYTDTEYILALWIFKVNVADCL